MEKKKRKEKDTFLKAFSFEDFESCGFSCSQKGVCSGEGLVREVEITGRKGKGREELF